MASGSDGIMQIPVKIVCFNTPNYYENVKISLLIEGFSLTTDWILMIQGLDFDYWPPTGMINPSAVTSAEPYHI